MVIKHKIKEISNLYRSLRRISVGNKSGTKLLISPHKTRVSESSSSFCILLDFKEIKIYFSIKSNNFKNKRVNKRVLGDF